jgi:hypothetical protein
VEGSGTRGRRSDRARRVRGSFNDHAGTSGGDGGRGKPSGSAAQASLVKTCAEQVANVASQMLNTGADNIACTIVKVVIPDDPGVVINGSQTC